MNYNGVALELREMHEFSGKLSSHFSKREFKTALQLAVVCCRRISYAPANRGEYPVHQAELPSALPLSGKVVIIF